MNGIVIGGVFTASSPFLCFLLGGLVGRIGLGSPWKSFSPGSLGFNLIVVRLGLREDADYMFHHAHCYALEGLLYAWHVLGDKRYLDAVVRGAEWLTKVQHRSGGVLEAYPSRRLVRRLAVDATAQAIRIWLLLYKALGGEVWLELEHAERGLSFLERNMFKRGEVRGGLPAYVYVIGPIGYRARRIHTWSIMFAVQAFLYYQLLVKLSLRDMIEYLF